MKALVGQMEKARNVPSGVCLNHSAYGNRDEHMQSAVGIALAEAFDGNVEFLHSYSKRPNTESPFMPDTSACKGYLNSLLIRPPQECC